MHTAFLFILLAQRQNAKINIFSSFLNRVCILFASLIVHVTHFQHFKFLLVHPAAPGLHPPLLTHLWSPGTVIKTQPQENHNNTLLISG